MLSPNTKIRLVHAVASQAVADQIENTLKTSSTPATPEEAQAILAKLNKVMNSEVKERLFSALAGDGNGRAGKELSRKVVGAKNVLQAFENGNETEAALATATLATTTPIIFTDVDGLGLDGAAKNGSVINTIVNPPSSNAGDQVNITATGAGPNFASINIIITPNDGTNNDLITVDLTTAELVEAINTGAVVGKNIFFSPGTALRLSQQTASGGGPEIFELGGEGDGLVATFSGGAAGADTDIAPAKAAMGMEKLSAADLFSLTHAMGDEAAAKEFKAAYDAMIEAIQAV